MYDKAILENGGTLKYVYDCYKNQKMCNKVVNNYLHASEFVPECYKTHKICGNAVDTHSSTIRYVPECYKTQETCYRAAQIFFFYLNLSMIKINQNKTQEYVTYLFLDIFF